MLLLMAIHFHVQQLSAIIELVSAALGMKVITRASSLGRIKYIFTHDVFTEQVNYRAWKRLQFALNTYGLIFVRYG